jgi:hypothetical protein
VSEQEAVCSKQTKKHMLGFDLVCSELARFVTSKENDAASFFGVPIKRDDKSSVELKLPKCRIEQASKYRA